VGRIVLNYENFNGFLSASSALPAVSMAPCKPGEFPIVIPVFIFVLENIDYSANQASPFTAEGQF
jgi:hypothetical protein